MLKSVNVVKTHYDKNPTESRHRGNLPQHNKGHIQQTHSKHHSQLRKTESISCKIRNKTRIELLFNIVLEVLATAVREEKEIKEYKLEKKK